MDAILAKLDAAFGSCFNSGPVAESTIASAEAELGLCFPPSYRIYLARYGATLGQGFEVFGLPHCSDPNQPPQWSHVVKSTLVYRPDALPENSVAISHDGMEFGYFLVCSKTDAEIEGSVVKWGPAHDGGQIIADSFIDFVENHLRR
jgi:hypothetical protein